MREGWEGGEEREMGGGRRGGEEGRGEREVEKMREGWGGEERGKGEE